MGWAMTLFIAVAMAWRLIARDVYGKADKDNNKNDEVGGGTAR
jgi:hypothetical protein